MDWVADRHRLTDRETGMADRQTDVAEPGWQTEQHTDRQVDRQMVGHMVTQADRHGNKQIDTCTTFFQCQLCLHRWPAALLASSVH